MENAGEEIQNLIEKFLLVKCNDKFMDFSVWVNLHIFHEDAEKYLTQEIIVFYFFPLCF